MTRVNKTRFLVQHLLPYHSTSIKLKEVDINNII